MVQSYRMSQAELIAELAALAAAAPSREALRDEVLERLDRRIGFDFGVLWRPGETTATVRGFDPAMFGRFAARERHYRADFAALAAAAGAQGGVTRDTAALTTRQRDRSLFYGEIIRPIGSAGFLHAQLALHGQTVCVLQLGRAGRAGFAFREREAQRLRALAPVLALGEAAHRPLAPLPPSTERFSVRESEVARLVALGFTNREIALACGTSPHTVRNQLAAIFRKAEVTTRAELTAWLCGGLG
jgi:DNA-binding CsgD family transcriptional regulator